MMTEDVDLKGYGLSRAAKTFLGRARLKPCRQTSIELGFSPRGLLLAVQS